MKKHAYLLLGTNLGDRKKNLAQARKGIEDVVGTIRKTSSIFQTAAWGNHNQPYFWNQALTVETELSAPKVLHAILAIEQSLGRVRKEKWGERIIDIDILIFEVDIINSPTLKIPHPELPNRRFALEPLAEIAGELIHPVHGITIGTLLQLCTDELPVMKVE